MATSEPDIQAGREYTLETNAGSTVRVLAESSVWENSKGIQAFDARLLEPFGNKDAGDTHTLQTHIFEVVEDGEPVAQCEVCGGHLPESELTFERVPGATLAFCSGCSK